MVNKDLVRLPLPRSHLVYAQVGLQRSVCDSSYCKKEKKVSKNFPFLMLSYCPQCSVNVRLYCDKEKQTPFVIFIINAIQISFCAAGEHLLASLLTFYFISIKSYFEKKINPMRNRKLFQKLKELIGLCSLYNFQLLVCDT